MAIRLKFALAALLLCTVAYGQTGPTATIQANGGRGHVVAPVGTPLALSIGLDPGSLSGRVADWWLVADTGAGLYALTLPASWSTQLSPAYQGPLFTLAPLPLVSLVGLPPGGYTLYFGVDLSMNGALDGTMHYASLRASVMNWDCTGPTADSLDALSATQKAFITSRGNPAVFTIHFLNEVVSGNGTLAGAAKPRRIENWVYNRSSLVSDLFDSGHFVRETVHGNTDDRLLPTHVSPGHFSACTTHQDVVALMGEPACTLAADFAGRHFTYLRYKPSRDRPAATVVFENGALNSVMAGYAWLAAGAPNLDLCGSP
jgi:hypothetical protein